VTPGVDGQVMAGILVPEIEVHVRNHRRRLEREMRRGEKR